MAPLPNNNTGVYYVDYRSNGREHTAQFRYNGSGAPPTEFVATAWGWFRVIEDYLPMDFTITGSRFRPAGGTFSLPVSVEGLDPPTPGLPTSPSEAPGFLGFVGRTLGGRRVRLFTLGVSFTPAGDPGFTNDYRATVGESTVVAAAVSYLSDWDTMVGIDTFQVLWNPYANLGYNAYWQRAVRG